MKPRLASRRAEQGNILIVTMCTMMVTGLALLTYLQLGKNQNQLVARSEVWNACLPIAEAGLEDALSHCGWNPSNWVSSGWSLTSSNTLLRSNSLAEGWYRVIIATNRLVSNQVVITSTGYFPMRGGGGDVSRSVQVVAARLPIYRYAIYGATEISFNGNGIRVDSYDSRDPLKSLFGMYNAALATDKGDVGTYNGINASYDIGNANIWGKVYMGPGGKVKHGPNGAVGGRAWHLGGKKGVQPGWLRTDLNISIPPVAVPPVGGTPGLRNLKVGTVTYDYVFDGGTYEETSLSGKVLVRGDALIYVTGKVEVEIFRIDAAGSAMLYVGGSSIKFDDTDNQTKRAANFQVLGLPAVKDVDLDNEFLGAVYTPQAKATFSGNKQIYGSICANNVILKGGADLHYDEALADPSVFKTQKRGFIISSWTEL